MRWKLRHIERFAHYIVNDSNFYNYYNHYYYLIKHLHHQQQGYSGNFVTVVIDLIPILNKFFDMLYCYCNLLDVNFPLQVTLVEAEYLQDYENVNSEPSQQLISKFLVEVISMLLCCSSLDKALEITS